MPEMQRAVGSWLRDGRLRHRETIVEGLERAPEALVKLLGGATIGKTLVRIA
jgi:NADPH-dependent curcumin reductase CurA